VDLIRDLEEIPLASAIVSAVAHQPFKEWSTTQWLERLQVGGVVMDVKGIAPREELVEAGVKIWRL
jgi:UDP-N-acetyl-D-galactosamine dehydrogenase